MAKRLLKGIENVGPEKIQGGAKPRQERKTEQADPTESGSG